MPGRAPGEGEEPEQEWDEADAVFIEKAWRLGAAYRLPPRTPLLLRAYYVLNHPPYLICRAQKVRAREFNDMLVRGVSEFEEFVARMQNRPHNSPQSMMITV